MMKRLVQHRIDRMIRVLDDPTERAIFQRYLSEVSQGRSQDALHHLAQGLTALPLAEQERLVYLYWEAGRRLHPREAGRRETIVPLRPRPVDGGSQRPG